VHRADDIPWGLVGSVFVEGIDRALRVGERLEVGLVGLVGLGIGLLSSPAALFGGVGQSGLICRQPACREAGRGVAISRRAADRGVDRAAGPCAGWW
jgi:acyl-CoA reductase-like NAD-dependent aldehyde dehydrogenase